MITLIRSDGSAEVLPKAGLEVLQKAVGGYIEYISLPDGGALVVNEEGQLMGLPLNRRASVVAGAAIVGDVVLADSIHEVCGGCSGCEPEEEGDSNV